jgi:hypothetical protein
VTIWEFRRLVRAHRFRLKTGFCPLGAAMEWPPKPTPLWAVDKLGLEYGYALGVVGGFDASTPQTDLPESAVFDRGERYGKRMRLVEEAAQFRAEQEEELP